MPESSRQHEQKVIAHVEKRLGQGRRKDRTRAELIRVYKRLLKIENQRIKMQHRAGADGVEIAQRRSHLLDVVLRALISETIDAASPEGEKSGKSPFTLVAVGGYGRSALSPGSDLDLLFLCPKNTNALPQTTVGILSEIITMLFDVGFKVGHAVRSVRECIQKANEDSTVKTAMIDSRLVTGDPALFEEFQTRFRKECIEGKERDYLKMRADEFVRRHEKHQRTVYVQEPNIKEGCGGLRDYQNILWIVYVKYGAKDLSALVNQKLLSSSAHNAMVKAHHFLMRVRNEMHWAEWPATDVLTLRLQGVVATNLGYPQDTILRRIESFMKDYYRHSRAIYMHSTSLMQAFQLLQEEEEERRPRLLPFLARRSAEQEEFDGFISRRGLIYPSNPEIFAEDRDRLMRLFRHIQQRHLQLSPQMRKLVKKHYSLVDRQFRYAKSNRLTFEAILSSKGDVGRILRKMHRVGFLGKYMPEFGALDCLVQHEFFHRFTADEHTLRCIDALDAVVDPESDCPSLLRQIFHQLEDPFVLYLALILHDTGRAENYRYHTDASTFLAAKVCRRLQIRGERRRLLLFLVDNHLVFWRTATTRNIDDPATIAEFSAVMQSRDYMETLFLMTYADSKGTNEEAWSSWKETLMTQLYRSTCAYQENQQDFFSRASRLKSELYAQLEAELEGDYQEELRRHFEGMPERYFFGKDQETITRHLKLFRSFLQHAPAGGGLETLPPILHWIDVREGGYTQLEICCQDRSLLLAKIAGTLACNRVNVLSADIFTRGDGLVLDVLRICTTNFEPVSGASARQRVEEMLRHVLDCSREIEDVTRELPAQKAFDPNLHETFPRRVFLSNTRNPNQTTMEVQALDRLGLLYSILTAIGQHHIQVDNARIATEKGAALDTFYLTDGNGDKINDRAILDALKADVEQAIR